MRPVEETDALLKAWQHQVPQAKRLEQEEAAVTLLSVCDNNANQARAALELAIRVKEGFYKDLAR